MKNALKYFILVLISLGCCGAALSGPTAVISFPGVKNELTSPDGTIKVVNHDPERSGLHTLSLSVKGKPDREIYRYGRGVQVAWSPKGDYLFITDHAESTNATCIILDTHTGQQSDLLPEAQKLGGPVAATLASPHSYLECQRWLSNTAVLAEAYGWGSSQSSESAFELTYTVGKGFELSAVRQ